MPSLSRLLCVALALSIAGAAAARTPIDPPRGDFRFAVFGDFNGSYGSLDYPPAVASALEAITDLWRPDLLLSPGDVIAGQSRSLPNERFAEMWQAFDNQVATPLRQAGIPYAFAMGNHDASSLRTPGGEFIFDRGREAARDYWSQPLYEGNLIYVDRSRFPFDYAFRSHRAFIVMLDASSATITEEQQKWLVRTLALPTARAADLQVVVGHLPLVAVGEGRDRAGEVLARPGELQRILEEGRVDLYISGHHAAYYPGRLGEVELLFAGGVGARQLLADDRPARSTVTLVDVWFEPLHITYSTFDLDGMRLVLPASLPRQITSDRGPVVLSQRAYPASTETAQR